MAQHVTTDFTYTGFTQAEAAYLKDAASKIRRVGQRMAADYLEVGQLLLDARCQFDPNGGAMAGVNSKWREWLDQAVGITPDTAKRMMAVSERYGRLSTTDQLPSFQVLYELTLTSTPAEVEQHVLNHPDTSLHKMRAIKKEVIDQKERHETAERDLPTPDDAREIARTTGRPAVSRDGKIYFGNSKEQDKENEARVELIYGVREAIELIAKLEDTPGAWIDKAAHWELHTFNDLGELDKAVIWLTNLKRVWESRRETRRAS